MPNGAAPHAPVPLTALERRYRRLLRWYPPSHRAAHREEMLGVLLDAARPSQRVPGVTQTVNLVACGLAIRGRRALTAGPWQDSLAVLSLIAPALMLVLAALNLSEAARQAVAIYQASPGDEGPFWTLDLVPQLGGPAAVMIVWLAVVILALAGRRRAAAAIAIAPLALDLTSLLADLVQRTGAWSGGLPMFLYTAGAGPVVLASLSACSLAFSAGPRRGGAIAGKRRACLMVAGLAAAFGFPDVVLLVSPFLSWPGYTWNILGGAAVAAAVIATCARAPAGGRVAVLIAAGPLAGLAGSLLFHGAMTATVVSMLVSLLIALLVWPVAIASWKGRVSRA